MVLSMQTHSGIDADSSLDASIQCWSAKPALMALSHTPLSVPEGILPDGWQSHMTEQGLLLRFPATQGVFSSAVLNGGYQRASAFINLRVSPECIIGVYSPESVFDDYLKKQTITCAPSLDDIIGMMTAASMRSCRIATVDLQDRAGHFGKFFVVVTTGIGNLRRAGDAAEYHYLHAIPEKVGTINLLVGSSVPLAPSATVEAMMLATEAKAAALMDLNLRSPVSGQVATGTGTDAVACTSPPCRDGQVSIDFVGKHTLAGQMIAQLVIRAVTDSIEGD